jgi:uroporphyrinogen decarboxylase
MGIMTSKERLVAAFERRIPDRLPATTHHVMPSFLEKHLNGISAEEFFDRFGLDPIRWVVAHRPDPSRGEYADPDQGEIGFLEARRASSDSWRVEADELPGAEEKTVRYRFVTPKKTLAMTLRSNEDTAWVVERLVKEKSDIDVIGEYVTRPLCDTAAVNREAAGLGNRGIVRGHIPCFDVFGQPGCWQDACCLAGTEEMILATFDDPGWVHAFLKILRDRKLAFVRSLAGARYDILELGGGSASTTVISPRLFDEFVAPYDTELIAAAHAAGQRIVCHTCGGMMPILERIADMGPDAMETFTPSGMGGDTNLREARRRIDGRVCMIGGFDQFHFFTGCTPAETRQEVRRCFEEAGEGGGYILSPSDHFFDADPELIRAFAEEAKECRYG